ncbi:ferritin-like domain-containing protein [Minwuia thermotolerans]|uniref:DUF455 domain-containing protein n=1 Tax=Minwuia thermotolerans TaxID=2056226 RepID=A0A2M9G178_9PROT|nr:ferritin-like domain-containing protein [Minwuia thermotolerans]PJK29472.1 DUF455 domain-containing protein [Minwuia thermotolerans]
MNDGDSLTAAACAVLKTSDPTSKAGAARSLGRRWRAGELAGTGGDIPPDRPGRPERPELRAPRDMPKRRKAGAGHSRIALLHAIAHIELNAIDLAVDMVARFAPVVADDAFVDDWLGVADDEARHFNMLAGRLADFGAAYGDLPAHDGLWEAASSTAHDACARLAVAHMVLEARGLDVTPAMVARLRRAGDDVSADILQIIHDEEIGHVAAGARWFDRLARSRGREPQSYWRELVAHNFRGGLKPPFNIEARRRAGMPPELYDPATFPGPNRGN